MLKVVMDKIGDFIVHILLIVITAVATILWSFNSSISANEAKVNGLETAIEVLRAENKTAHEQIISLLRKP